MPIRSPWYLRILFILGAAAATARAEDRTFQAQLVATLMTSESSDKNVTITNLLSDDMPSQSTTSSSGCPGPDMARVIVTYSKGAADVIVATGEVQLLEQVCRGLTQRGDVAPSVRQSFSRSIARGGPDAIEVIDMPAPSGARLSGMLTLKNLTPSCTATHVRWRTHIDSFNRQGVPGAFDSRQVSLLLEPDDEPLMIGTSNVFSNSTRATVVATLDVVEAHSLNLETILEFFDRPGSTPQGRTVQPSVVPPGPPLVITTEAEAGGRAVATTTVENRGQPRNCTVDFTFAPYFVVEVPSTFWVIQNRENCGAITRGCYSEKSGTGWVRIDDVTCTGKGSGRRCQISGAGRGLVCSGNRWTFDSGTVDADCAGARLQVSCLADDAAVVRFTPTGLTIRRESRMDERTLRHGGTCQ